MGKDSEHLYTVKARIFKFYITCKNNYQICK